MTQGYGRRFGHATHTPASGDPQSTEDGWLKPISVRIPKIGAESTLVEAGLDQDQAIEVPPVSEPIQAAWYRFSQVPGDPGPAILLGHVDGTTTEPELRLITCGGAFDKEEHSYKDNIIVYAKLTA